MFDASHADLSRASTPRDGATRGRGDVSQLDPSATGEPLQPAVARDPDGPARFVADALVDAVTAERRPAATATPTGLTAPDFADRERPSLDLLIANVSRILGSEIALFYQPAGKGYPLPVISSCGLGPLDSDRITRSPEGGLVGGALGAQRAILEPLDRQLEADLSEAVGGINLTHAVAAPVRLARALVLAERLRSRIAAVAIVPRSRRALGDAGAREGAHFGTARARLARGLSVDFMRGVRDV